MKFPRNAKIFRGQLDAAPFAGVFFLLVIFLALSSNIIYTPGIRVNLPQGGDLPGTDKPTIAVAVDANGQYYLNKKPIRNADLGQLLNAIFENRTEDRLLYVKAHKDLAYGKVLDICSFP